MDPDLSYSAAFRSLLVNGVSGTTASYSHIANSKAGMFFRTPTNMPDGPLKEPWLLKLANLFVQGQRICGRDKTADKETMGGLFDVSEIHGRPGPRFA